ncbi:MAG: ATP-dependent Clp protease ATP-binding subunit, partial [Candidatus Kerfeldbacteria bacterium]|nr:ATP-dependent Clp protease ATP-binding subunit [Candidatus Kerfeldbacteria bacterium]
MSPILEKFTTHLKNTLRDAILSARLHRHASIEPVDVIRSLVLQRGSMGAEVIWKSGYTRPSSEIPMRRTAVETDHVDTMLTNAWSKFSESTQHAILRAAMTAVRLKHRYIGTEHLLSGLLNPQIDADIRTFLREHRVRTQDIEKHLQIVLKSTSKFPEITRIFADRPSRHPVDHDGMDASEEHPSALEFFATDMTSDHYQQHVDPVIGRESEIERMIHILCRRTKNNPVLIGEPGVGKTAIVEGLAKRILQHEVPPILTNKRVLNLDLSLVVAGTMYRGEFEGRMKQIIDELREDPNVILFIDEMHMLVGAGSTSGSMDAANILKPALAKGQISVVGATTYDEYRKYIESDAALERRFQPVVVDELSPEDALTVLRGIKPYYEQFHHVTIDDSAIQASVELSTRYLQDKLLPDKAIDVLDEAASRLRVNEDIDPLSKTIETFERDLKHLRGEKIHAVEQEQYQEALQIKKREQMIMEKLAELHQQQQSRTTKSLGTVTAEDIAHVVSRITKIPLMEITATEKEQLRNLDTEIKKYLIGQNDAVESVASFVKRSRAGLSHANRPTASFMFLGPTGVGKTELAKLLARTVFKDEKALIRIDMSEFSESFQASKLLGAPAGYVGYKEGGKLTETVRRRPYSVVLFDEIEKAHPDIFNLLLQILDEGHLTDATGKNINFKNTIVV